MRVPIVRGGRTVRRAVLRRLATGFAASLVVLAQGQAVHQETRLGPVPETFIGQASVDSDGWNIAGVSSRGGKVHVWFNGAEGPAYDDIAKGHPVLSPTGGRIAADVCLGAWQGGQHFAVIDATTSEPYDALFGPSFLAEGKRVWAIGWKGTKVVPLVDGTPGAEWDQIADPVVTDDGRHLAYSARTGDKWTVTVDGVAGPSWDEVVGIAYHQAAQGFTYAGRRGDEWYVWAKGTEMGPYQEVAPFSPEIDPQGRLVFRAKADGLWRVYVNGQATVAADEIGGYIAPAMPQGNATAVGKLGEKWAVFTGDQLGPLFDEIMAMTPVVTPAGELTYAARDGEKWTVVVQGAEFGPYQEVHYSSPYISSTGRVAYIVRKEDKWQVLLDGAESPAYENFVYYEKSFALAFSDDGAHVAWAAKRNGKAVVVLDGVEGPEYDDIAAFVPLFLPGSTAPTYVGRTGAKDRLVLNGEAMPEHDRVFVETDWSEDTGPVMVAAVFTDGEKQSVWANGRQGAWYDEVGEINRSADGTRICYGAKKGEKWVGVVDGVEWPECDALAQSPWFDASGKHAVCIGKFGEQMAIVLDGVTQPLYASLRGPFSYHVSEGFSADGMRFAYIAETGDKSFMVVDGVQGPAYSWIPGDGPPRYRPDGTLEYLGVRDKVLYRVRVAPAN